MEKRIEEVSSRQGLSTLSVPRIVGRQLVIPIAAVIGATRRGLRSFVIQAGIAAVQHVFAADAEALAGPKGKHSEGRTHHHWGTTRTPLPFGGQEIVLDRPRVRRKGGGEATLPSVESFRQADAMPDHVVEKVVLGVSTRGYERSLDALDDEVETRGASKSAASRALIEGTKTRMNALLEARLDELAIVAIYVDGVEVAGHTVVHALGVTRDGSKVPLALTVGSTENAVLCTTMVQSMVSRGLTFDGSMLFVIDGGKGIAKAIRDVFGKRALIQRCQVHKMRNVAEHLPQARRAQVLGQMREAYKNRSAKTAKQQLVQLAKWLESCGEHSAADSLREGLDDTLTVLKLGLPQTLTRTLSTTNSIENMNSTLRRVSRNVKRWQSEEMIRRWMTLGVAQAQKTFRRVKGHQDINTLVAALRDKRDGVASGGKAA